jgi:hypothetical protein
MEFLKYYSPNLELIALGSATKVYKISRASTIKKAIIAKLI